jgi:hypothetical protein
VVSTDPITLLSSDWLTLSGATDQNHQPDAWDVNYGPSAALDRTTSIVSVDSESFTITGDPIPEPATLMLFGSGMLALVGILRRKQAR